MATQDMALDLDEIQGNILAGFNKNWQSFLFFTLPADARAACAWLTEIVGEVAPTREVKAFNDVFRAARARHEREGAVKATWMNLAFTHPGLGKLGVSDADLAEFPSDFREGMRARNAMIGDLGENDPSKWPAGLGTAAIDALMVVAADEDDDRNREVTRYVRDAARHGVTLAFQQNGTVRRDAPGYEHFGFKDGISQPRVKGFDAAAEPGQRLIDPGIFVLGYPSVNPETSNPKPGWARNGSYLVFRRLRQDVPAFLEFVTRQAQQEKMSVDLFAAKLVGRYRSGAPLEGADNSAVDPGTVKPQLLEKDSINDFKYSGDPDGAQVPRCAHIRRSYPRDADPPGSDESELRRMIRRGIPFGQPFEAGGPPGRPFGPQPDFPDDRGLCFVCYQSSIADSFEFVQQNWCNDPDFTANDDGPDPVISQISDQRSFKLPGAPSELITVDKQWVTTTGGEYFFAPSISALKQCAALAAKG